MRCRTYLKRVGFGLAYHPRDYRLSPGRTSLHIWVDMDDCQE